MGHIKKLLLALAPIQFLSWMGLSRAALVGILLLTGKVAAADSSSTYGEVFNADGLANLEIGKSSGRTVDYRFRAQHSGTMASARFFFVFRGLGYYAGNGGQVQIDVEADDGTTNHRPSGVSLANALITNPLSNNFPRVTFNQSVSVQAGQLYHFVFTNPYSDPINNYVSIDDIYNEARVPNMQPTVSDTDLAVLFKDGSNPLAINYGHTPIFDAYITGAGGTNYTEGVGYIDARSCERAYTDRKRHADPRAVHRNRRQPEPLQCILPGQAGRLPRKLGVAAVGGRRRIDHGDDPRQLSADGQLRLGQRRVFVPVHGDVRLDLYVDHLGEYLERERLLPDLSSAERDGIRLSGPHTIPRRRCAGLQWLDLDQPPWGSLRHIRLAALLHGDSESSSDTHADANGDTDGNADSDSDTHSDCYANADRNGDTDGHSNSDADGHSNSNADTHADGDTDGNAKAHGNTYANADGPRLHLRRGVQCGRPGESRNR